MVKRIQLVGHLGTEALYGRYRAAADRVERSQLQIIWLLTRGQSLAEVSAASGYSTRWIQKLMHRYNAGGAAALGDRRHGNAGARPLLNAAQLVELAAALKGVPPGGGLWSGPKVAQWIAEKIGRDHIHPHRGWVYLKRLGMSRQAPRARHERAASPQDQAAFKKNSTLRWTKPRRPTRAPRSRSGPSTSTASA